MHNLFTHWRWLIPLLTFSGDALAWGLYTHVYFAQLLLWAVPLTDPRFRNAIKAFPKLVLAGACLPDLALWGEREWGQAFSSTHRWQHARKLLDEARGGEEYALSLGYVSHLLVDVIAHHHFVPAHEKLWGNFPVLTHVACEWAMDMHVSAQLFAEPHALLENYREQLALYLSKHFNCPVALAAHGVDMLSAAENLLRTSRLSHLCYHGAKLLDAGMGRRFNYYLSETGARLMHIDRILLGEEPVWDANPHAADPQVKQRIARIAPLQLRHRIPLPTDLFEPGW